MPSESERFTDDVTPLAVPAGASGVLFYGGTFDPPHRGHTELGAAARDRIFGGGGWLVFVPAARSPLKDRGPDASDTDRVEMLGLATGTLARSVVWTDEIDRAGAGPSYTIDTLRRARRVLPRGTPARLLIGDDQAAEFHRWREARAVIDAAEPAVLLRASSSPDEVVNRLRATGFWTEEELAAWRARVLQLPLRKISASAIRAGFAAGRMTDESLVDGHVRDYIAARGLYRRG